MAHACPRRVTEACAVPESRGALRGLLGVCRCRCPSLAACWDPGTLYVPVARTSALQRALCRGSEGKSVFQRFLSNFIFFLLV